MRRAARVPPAPIRVVLVVSLLGLGCFQPTEQLEGGALPLAQWCTRSVYEFTCDLQIGCGVADADAGCANIGANSRLASAPDPCSPALLAALDAGTVAYDAQAAARCLGDRKTSCGVTSPSRLDCAAVFVGAGADGTPCNFDAQCASGLWCSFEGGTCPGACRPRVAAGGVTTAAPACATDLAQPLDGGAYRCLDFSQLGQACDADQLCAAGLHCDQGLCAADLEAGASCATGQCAPGTTCISGQCAQFARRGAPCASQFLATNPAASPCQLGLACRAGTCGDALRAGESCREEPNRCGAGTRCDLTSSICNPLAPAGAACTSVTECLSPLICTGGTCRSPAALSDPCDAISRCEPTRRCVDGVCVTSARECR